MTTSNEPAVRGDPSTDICLRLYIAGDAPNSVVAVARLHAALALFPGCKVELETVDVLKEPDRAHRDNVLVTPMLVRLAPGPERRVLGNLSDRARLLGVLGLDEDRGG